MIELLKLLAQFLHCLRQQMTQLEELLSVLAREEELVVSFCLPELEKLVTEKDQIVRIAQAAEVRRQQILKKLCFMMAFDARGRLPTLSEFLDVAKSYLRNIERLVDAQTHASFCHAVKEIEEVSAAYRAAFLHAQPRIEENKVILRALSANLKRSLAVLQNESTLQNRYNERGRGVDALGVNQGFAFVRVRA